MTAPSARWNCLPRPPSATTTASRPCPSAGSWSAIPMVHWIPRPCSAPMRRWLQPRSSSGLYCAGSHLLPGSTGQEVRAGSTGDRKWAHPLGLGTAGHPDGALEVRARRPRARIPRPSTAPMLPVGTGQEVRARKYGPGSTTGQPRKYGPGSPTRKYGPGSTGQEVRARKYGPGSTGQEVRARKYGPGSTGQEVRARKYGPGSTGQEVRAHLGVETQRQWSDRAIARTTPILMGLFSWITLTAHSLQQESPITQRTAAWYAKPAPTFVDAIALARRHLWLASESFSMSVSDDDRENPFPICIPGLSIPSPTPLERTKSRLAQR